MKRLKNSYFLVGVIAVFIKQTCADAVTQTDCKDGGNECDSIPKAVCDTRTSKCKCTTGYTEDTTNTNTCVKEATGLMSAGLPTAVARPAKSFKGIPVSHTDCTDGGHECDSIPKAVCDIETKKCKCTTGYIEDTTNTASCVKVFGTDCTGNNACPGLEHSLCKDSKCACAEKYEEKNDICTLTVSSITCSAPGTQCDTVPNAECDVTATNCKCSDGYVMDVDVCVQENAAATLGIGTATLLLLVILMVVTSQA